MAVAGGCLVSYSSSFSPSLENSNLDSSSAWVAKTNSDGQWVQVGCGTPRLWTGVVLQGRADKDEWVTAVNFATSMDSQKWTIVDHGKIVAANEDCSTKVRINFNEGSVGRFLRIYPKTWNNWPSLRLDAWSLVTVE